MGTVEFVLLLDILSWVWTGVLIIAFIYHTKVKLTHKAGAATLKILLRQAVPLILAALIYGVLCYKTEDFQELPSWRHSVRKLEGPKSAFSICLTGLSFLLIFRTSQMLSRWWEARGHLGSLMMHFKVAVAIACETDEPEAAQRQRCVVTLCEIVYECLKDQLQPQKISPSLVELLRRLRTRKRARRSCGPSTKLIEGLEIDDREVTCCLGISEDQMHVWLSCSPTNRTLLCWTWLRHEMVASSSSHGQEVNKIMRALLEAIHGLTKIKSHGKETTVLSMMEQPLYFVMTTFIVPHYLSNMFHAELTQQELNEGRSKFDWRFCLALVLIVFFFSGLKVFMKQMEDPFGDDITDLNLETFEQSLCSDFECLLEDATARQQDASHPEAVPDEHPFGRIPV